MSPRIYLDANATTPLLPQVLEAMLPYFTERFGNASAVHSSGQRARSAVDRAREQVAALLNARASEIVFTGSGTESDNTALFGLLSPGDHLVTTAIEHHAVRHAAEELRKRGVAVTIVPPDERDYVSADAIRSAIRRETKLVSVMLANNETGVIQPITEIAAVAHTAGALLHTDAVQTVGKIPVDVKALGCDLLSLSGHKFHAPQGVGALYLRRGLQLRPLLHGGAHERERRAGTENLAGIVGLGAAAEYAMKSPAKETLARMRDQLESELLQMDGVQINGAGTDRVPNTTNLRLSEIDADELLMALDLQGVEASAGSACQSGSTEPSHVLLAMGLSHIKAKSSLRLSLSRVNTEDEVLRAASIIRSTVERQRAISR